MLNSKSKTTEMAETPKSDATALAKRHYPIGAELIGGNETRFRVWAPKAQHVDLVLEESAAKNAKRTFHPMEAEEDGYFSGVTLSTGWAAWFFLRCRSHEVPMDGPSVARSENKRPNHVRNAHWHIHQGRDMARRGRAVGRAGAHRHHRGRDDADRGFPGKIRLGLRWRGPFCTDALVWHAGRSARLCRSCALVRLGRDSGCGLQSLWSRRELSCRLFQRLFDSRQGKRLGRLD